MWLPLHTATRHVLSPGESSCLSAARFWEVLSFPTKDRNKLNLKSKGVKCTMLTSQYSSGWTRPNKLCWDIPCARVVRQLLASAKSRHSSSHLAANYMSTALQMLSPQLIKPLWNTFGFQSLVHISSFLETGKAHIFFLTLENMSC